MAEQTFPDGSGLNVADRFGVIREMNCCTG